MRVGRLLMVVWALVSLWGMAGVVPEGAGIIYGEDHVFSLKAPKGWVLDNESGVQSGVHAVFYKEGETWADSKAVAYAKSRPIDGEGKTVEDAVKAVLADFHGSGSPDYKGKKVKEIKTKDGKVGVLYHFSGDQWGNYEAVCYFKEEKTINFVVLSGRDKKAFEGAEEAFAGLCGSYFYISDHYEKGKAEKPGGEKAGEGER